MTFQPSPEQIQWLGVVVIFSAFLQFAERTWNLVRKITDYFDKRRKVLAKERKVEAQMAQIANTQHRTCRPP
jgi:hypothetical protein